MADKQTAKVVVSVKNVKKDFHRPHEKSARSIKSAIVHAGSKKNNDIDTQHALKGVSFDVHEGEFFGIVGRNGSGKSTLLKMIAGIYQPTHGKITTHGKLVPFIELGVGFNPELTGRENIYLNGALLGFTVKEIDAMYDEIVDFAELHEFMEQKLKNYSSGMQVRLAFAVAIKAQGDVLILDEVLAVGDADFQRKCYSYFKKLKKENKTVVLVTHDMNAVKEYCSRAVLINEGLIEEIGDPEDVSRAYLKLFNSVDETVQDNGSQAKRWGNGAVRVVSQDITIDKKIKIRFDVSAKQATSDVVMGFRFYDEAGVVLAGASSVNAKYGAIKSISFKANETKRIEFEFDNILGSGSHRMGYTIRLADMVTVCDDDEYAAVFQHSAPDSYQPIVCPVSLSITSAAKKR